MELQKALYLSSCVLGGFIALSLLARSYKNQAANRTLAIFILLVLLSPLTSYLYQAGLQVPMPLVIASQISILLYGPIGYVFIRQLNHQPVTPAITALHFAPFILLFFAKLASIHTDGALGITLFFGLVFTYGGYNCFVIIKRRKTFKRLHREYQNSAYYWLAYIIYGLFILTLIKSAIILSYLLSSSPANYIWHAMEALVCVYIIVMAGFSLWRPTVFFNDTKLQLDKPCTASNDEVAWMNDIPVEVIKPERSLEFDHQSALPLIEQLHSLMSAQKLALNSDLTLDILAKKMHLRKNQLSELLNVHMQTSFYQYLNEHRLQAALDLLQDQNCRLSILDIAYEAGFNNKNSFYKIFKSDLGMTPTQYRASNKGGCVY